MSEIVHPISLDISLANVPGSKGEKALNVWEIRRTGLGEVGRENRVAPPELERRQRVFPESGRQGPKGKNWTGGELMPDPRQAGERHADDSEHPDQEA